MLLSMLDTVLSTHGINVVAKATRLALGRVLMTGLLQGFRPEHTGTGKTNHATLKTRLTDALLALNIAPAANARAAAAELSGLWGDSTLCDFDRTFLCYVKHRLNLGYSKRDAILDAIRNALPPRHGLTPAQRAEIRELAESYLWHKCFFPSPDRVARLADRVHLDTLKELCLIDVMKGIKPHYERKLRFYARATGTTAESLIGTEFFTKVIRNFNAVAAFGNDDKHVVQYPKSAAQSALKDDVKRLAHPEKSRIAGYNSDMLKGTSIGMTSREVAACDLYTGEAYSLTNPLDNVAIVNAEEENVTSLAVRQIVQKAGVKQRQFLALMGGLHCPRFSAWCRKRFKLKDGDNSDWREAWSSERYLRAVSEYLGVVLDRAKNFLRAVARALCLQPPKFAM